MGMDIVKKIGVQGGAPKFVIPKQILANLIEDRFLISELSNIFRKSCLSADERVSSYKLSFCDVPDNKLDNEVKKVISEFPYCGEVMLRQL